MGIIRFCFSSQKWKPTEEIWSHVLSLVQFEERERIGKFMFKNDAKASIIGRLLIRKVICEKFNKPWELIEIQRTSKGRPTISAELVEPPKSCQAEFSDLPHLFDFNVSHQGEWVVLAAADAGPIGIDIVQIDERKDRDVDEFFRLMTRQFTADEWSYIHSGNSLPLKLKNFYRLWALKESFVKALGVGISYSLQSLSFYPIREIHNDCKPITDTVLKIDGLLDTGWKFEETMLNNRYISTIAMMNENPDDTGMLPYCELGFKELIIGSRSLTSQNYEQEAREFMAKDTSPFEN